MKNTQNDRTQCENEVWQGWSMCPILVMDWRATAAGWARHNWLTYDAKCVASQHSWCSAASRCDLDPLRGCGGGHVADDTLEGHLPDNDASGLRQKSRRWLCGGSQTQICLVIKACAEMFSSLTRPSAEILTNATTERRQYFRKVAIKSGQDCIRLTGSLLDTADSHLSTEIRIVILEYSSRKMLGFLDTDQPVFSRRSSSNCSFFKHNNSF